MEPFTPQNRPYSKRETYLGGWRLYPGAFIQHHLQGLGAGLIILLGNPKFGAFAALWTILYIAYQGLSWIRKKDSPALDLTDYMVGFGLALVGVGLWNLVI